MSIPLSVTSPFLKVYNGVTCFPYLIVCSVASLSSLSGNKLCVCYSSRTIVVDFRHRFTVTSINDTPVPIGQIHLFHSYV